MKTFLSSGFVFRPGTRQIDFAGVPGFRLAGLLLVENLTAGGRVIYAAADPDLAASADGALVTLVYDTRPMAAGDALRVIYEDGAQAHIRTRSESPAVTEASLTLAPGVAQTIEANPDRAYLRISNTGANPLGYAHAGTATAAASHPLGAGQSVAFDPIPSGAVSLISANGTTAFVTKG